MLRKSLLYVGTIGVFVASSLYAAVASRAIGINFPELTGKYPVGRASYDLTDPSRKEIFGSDPKANREIVVMVYYPAVVPQGAKPTPYASGKMADLLASQVHLPAVAFQLIQSHAYENVPVASGSFPVVLFSPGIGTPPLEYASEVEDLASHGYVVAEIYHTYSVPVTVFSDGRVATISDAGFRSEIEPDGTSQAKIDQDRNRIGSVWVADARFTLDQLMELNVSDPLLKGHIDLSEVGMYGHSFGGATTAQVLEADKRFKAGINMDGTAFTTTDSAKITQPFMWMASDYSQVTDSQLKSINMSRNEFNAKIQEKNNQRDAFLRSLPSGYLFILEGSTHNSYIADEGLLGGLVPGMSDPLATVDPRRAVTDIDGYVVAFFDQYLKHEPSKVLSGDSAQYPDVKLTVIHK